MMMVIQVTKYDESIISICWPYVLYIVFRVGVVATTSHKDQ